MPCVSTVTSELKSTRNSDMHTVVGLEDGLMIYIFTSIYQFWHQDGYLFLISALTFLFAFNSSSVFNKLLIQDKKKRKTLCLTSKFSATKILPVHLHSLLQCVLDYQNLSTCVPCTIFTYIGQCSYVPLLTERKLNVSSSISSNNL